MMETEYYNLYNVKEETIRLLSDIHSNLVKSNASEKTLCTVRDLALDVFNTNNGEQENGNGNFQE